MNYKQRILWVYLIVLVSLSMGILSISLFLLSSFNLKSYTTINYAVVFLSISVVVVSLFMFILNKFLNYILLPLQEAEDIIQGAQVIRTPYRDEFYKILNGLIFMKQQVKKLKEEYENFGKFLENTLVFVKNLGEPKFRVFLLRDLRVLLQGLFIDRVEIHFIDKKDKEDFTRILTAEFLGSDKVYFHQASKLTLFVGSHEDPRYFFRISPVNEFSELQKTLVTSLIQSVNQFFQEEKNISVKIESQKLEKDMEEAVEARQILFPIPIMQPKIETKVYLPKQSKLSGRWLNTFLKDDHLFYAVGEVDLPGVQGAFVSSVLVSAIHQLWQESPQDLLSIILPWMENILAPMKAHSSLSTGIFDLKTNTLQCIQKEHSAFWIQEENLQKIELLPYQIFEKTLSEDFKLFVCTANNEHLSYREFSYQEGSDSYSYFNLFTESYSSLEWLEVCGFLSTISLTPRLKLTYDQAH